MSRRGRRLTPAKVAVPLAIVLIAWGALGDPGGLAAYPLVAVVQVAGTVMTPALLLMARQLPLLLVPASLLAWWRRGREDRPAIPARLRRAVYAADRHRCCYCGSPDFPQLDHVRPWSLGGLTSLWNMVTLCGKCNKVKSNYWPERPRAYRPFAGHDNPREAMDILRAELWRRRNPLRWLRASLALWRTA